MSAAPLGFQGLLAASAMIVLVLTGMANIAEIDVADLALAARGPL
jgi:hypothetical protein